MGRILKTAASLVTGLILLTTAAVGTIPAEAVSSCHVAFKTYEPIKQGSAGAEAKAMECLLHKAGFTTTVNSRFSASDAKELAKFRKSRGLNPLLIGGRRAWSALLSSGTTPHLRKDHRENGGGQRLVAKPVSKAPKQASKAEKAPAFAKKQLGDRYVRGGPGPNGWDCCGLTMKAWKTAGVKLSHSAGQQYKIGNKISKSQLRNGDLVFFYRGIGHVALYAGNGRVIHAPHPGKRVSYIKMKYMPYMGARRPG